MLEQLRSEIDACDAILTDVLFRRLTAATRIADYKKEHKVSFHQPERETAILQKLAQSPGNKIYGEHIQEIYKSIFRVSRCIQMQHVFPYNIVLIGFMGSGKTTVGRYLADITGYAYYDVDAIIEQESGMTVQDIFSQHGEAFFRSLELQAVRIISALEHAVISGGGGIILDETNVKQLKQKGKLVWLTAEPENLYERIRYESNRPLIVNRNFEEIKKMIEMRNVLYGAVADYRIGTDGKPVAVIGEEIINMVMHQS